MAAFMHRTLKHLRPRGSTVKCPSATWSRFDSAADHDALVAIAPHFRTVDDVTDKPRAMTAAEKDADRDGARAKHRAIARSAVIAESARLVAQGFVHSAKTFSNTEYPWGAWGARGITAAVIVMTADGLDCLTVADTAAMDSICDAQTERTRLICDRGGYWRDQINQQDTIADIDAVVDDRPNNATYDLEA